MRLEHAAPPGVHVRVEGQPAAIELAPLSMPDIIACVWELEVIKFERDQWVRTAMRDASGAPGAEALERYLGAAFAGAV